MPELSRQQKAALTKRSNTRNALVQAAPDVFDGRSYHSIRAEDIFHGSGISSATFYEYFSGKSSWAATILDAQLNKALDQPTAREAEIGRTPRALLLGHFGLLDAVSAPLSGITQALVEERAAGEPYTELVPRYYGEVTQALRDGQDQQVFRADIDATELADLTLDSLASVYAIHLDERATRAADMAAILLDGLVVGE